MRDVDRFGRPAGAYVTWNDDGRTFRVEGHDAGLVVLVALVARQLVAA